jgi:hypothetical protein
MHAQRGAPSASRLDGAEVERAIIGLTVPDGVSSPTRTA